MSVILSLANYHQALMDSSGEEMAVSEDREYWRRFFQLYKELPELWNLDHEGYKRGYKKNVAYLRLAEYLKKRDPTANIQTVKKKINTLRGSYRREVRKIKKDDGYVPNLWYYENLSFLGDGEQWKSREEPEKVEIKKCKHECKKQEQEDFDSLIAEQPDDEDEHYLEEMICDQSQEFSNASPTPLNESMNDCAEIYGKAWAAQFRHLSLDQQIHAKRAVDEILYLGLLGELPNNRTASPTLKK